MTGQSGSKIADAIGKLTELKTLGDQDAYAERLALAIEAAWAADDIDELVHLGVLSAEDAERERENTELAEAL